MDRESAQIMRTPGWMGTNLPRDANPNRPLRRALRTDRQTGNTPDNTSTSRQLNTSTVPSTRHISDTFDDTRQPTSNPPCGTPSLLFPSPPHLINNNSSHTHQPTKPTAQQKPPNHNT